MDDEPKSADLSNESGFKKAKLKHACEIFAKRFKNFIELGLHESKLQNNAEPEVLELLEKIKELQDQFHDAITERGGDFRHIDLPFFSIGKKSAESSTPKLIIEVIPCSSKKFDEIHDAFKQMEQMAYMLAKLKSVRSKPQGVLELLKILYLHIQRQILPEGEIPETLNYDADAALQLLEVLDIRPSQTLMEQYMKADPSGTNWLTAVRTNIDYTRTRLESEAKGEAKTAAIRVGVQDDVENI